MRGIMLHGYLLLEIIAELIGHAFYCEKEKRQKEEEML